MFPQVYNSDQPRKDAVQSTLTDQLTLNVLKTLRLEDGRPCLIWSINLKQAHERLANLVRFTDLLPRRPDVIAIQDPPPRLPYAYVGDYWQSWSAADGSEITPEDDPNLPRYVPPYPSRKKPQPADPEPQIASPTADPEPQTASPTAAPKSKKRSAKPLTKVAFLIHKNILPAQYRIVEADGKNKGNVATLYLATEQETIAIHNVYNHEYTLDIEELMEGVADRSFVQLMVGDYNLHDREWDGELWKGSDPEGQGALLLSETMQNALKLLNTPGVPTYSRGEEETGKYLSVLDLAFVTETITDRVEHEILRNVWGFTSDHRITQVSIDLNLVRQTNTRYIWDLTPRAEFEVLVLQLSKKVELPESPSRERLEQVLKGTFWCDRNAITY